jgi:lysophospholipase L1-like esterase
VPQLPIPDDSNECVLVEIGANDMVDGIRLEQFESALDRLLESAGSKGKRHMVVLELPLLPGRWGYGAVQRRLARKYGCTVVPKRVLAKVQLTEGSTSDGAHLTQRGHDEFARALCTWLAWDVMAASERRGR